MKDKLEILKAVSSFTVGVSTGMLVTTLLKNARPTGLSIYGNIIYGIGGWGVTQWISMNVVKQYEEQFDTVISAIDSATFAIQEAKLKHQIEQEEKLN
jgi:uncharacterized membrane protein YeaQ/YmgE (transglycosylase-associated protein family)